MTKLVRESDLTGFDSAAMINTVRPCDLCGAADSLDTPGDPSRKIRICSGCGFVYVSERRSTADVAHAWDEIYASGGYDPNWPGVKARLFYVAQWIESNIGLAGRSVLDIGAGNGNFVDYCRSLGAHCVGLDPGLDNVRKIKARDIPCFHGWAADDSPYIGQYDIVSLCWTLENVGDCLAVLRYAKRHLAPNGHLVVATGSRINVPFKKPLRSYLPQDPNYPHDTHCFRWSIKSLFDALRISGMEYFQWNDFTERDELIVSSTKVSDDALSVNREDDWASFTLNHFRRWHEQFP